MDTTKEYHTKSERQIPCVTTYMCNLKDDSNRNRLIDTENRLAVAKGWGGGGEMEWEAAASRCKLLYIERIKNKVPLYSTGNYIQYPMINHNGKEYIKQCIYMCVCVCACV